MTTKLTFPFSVKQVDEFSVVAELKPRREVFNEESIIALQDMFHPDEVQEILDSLESLITRRMLLGRMSIKTCGPTANDRLRDLDKI